jgi:hypothetical protein
MTVSATNFPFETVCDGSTSVFYFTSPIIRAEDLVVTKRTAAGVDTILAYGTEYEVTGENNKFSSGGYITTVTYVSGARAVKNWDNGDTIIIDRETDVTQDTDYKVGRKLDLALIGSSFDKLTIILQEQAKLIARMLSVPVGDVAASLELPLVVDRASKFLCFDSAGNVTVAAGVTAADVVVSSFMESVVGAANAAAARTLLELTYASVAEGKAGTSSELIINPAVLAAVIQGGTMTYAVAAGTDTYTADLVPPISEYIEGAVYYVRFTNANTNATVTLALNGLAAKTLKKDSEAALSVGDIQANSRHALLYSNGYFILMDAFKLVAGQVPNGLIVEAMIGTGAVTATKYGAASIPHSALDDNIIEANNVLDGTLTYSKMNKVITDGTDVTLGIALTERSTTSANYAKLKEIRILQTGTVTVIYSHMCSQANGGKTRLYINGVAVGAENATGTSYATITTTGFAVVANDLIQIYAKMIFGSQAVKVKDMYVKSAGFLTDVVID